MLLTETNILDAVYCHNHLGYDVICSEETVTVSRGDQRGFVLVSRKQPLGVDCQVNELLGLNTVSYEVVDGNYRTPLIGAYLPPSTLDNLP